MLRSAREGVLFWFVFGTALLLVIAFWAVVGLVAYHFVGKYW